MRAPLCLLASVFFASALGCGRTPSPLWPSYQGSIGTPNRGVLTASAELAPEGPGFKWLRREGRDDRHHGVPRFVKAIERAAANVEKERPGAILSIGDLSVKNGGVLLPHLSHRSGRDADLLLYMTTLDGAPVESPGFIHVGPDGLAFDDKSHRFLRFDVERTWLLVKFLVEDPEARVQWVFANRNVEALLLQWARARGESGETMYRAMEVMLEPHPGGPHDDHVHVRTACSPAEIAQGCEHTGPIRPWILALDADKARSGPPPTSDWELLEAIFKPFGTRSNHGISDNTDSDDKKGTGALASPVAIAEPR